MANFKILLIGHKARQGKDETARILKKYNKHVHITHFADVLKDVVENKNNSFPLIFRTKRDDGKYLYHLYDHMVPDNASAEEYLPDYFKATQDELPYLHGIFEERKIDYYQGSVGKDSKVLQFWGTDYMRSFRNKPTYWIDKTVEQIRKYIEKYDNLKHDSTDVLICIPDCRFLNEANVKLLFNLNFLGFIELIVF